MGDCMHKNADLGMLEEIRNYQTKEMILVCSIFMHSGIYQRM